MRSANLALSSILGFVIVVFVVLVVALKQHLLTFLKRDLILNLWMYFSFIESKCSFFPSDVSGRQLAVSCKETVL